MRVGHRRWGGVRACADRSPCLIVVRCGSPYLVSPGECPGLFPPFQVYKKSRRLLADWERPDLTVDPRVFSECAPRGADSGKPGVTACRYKMWMGTMCGVRCSGTQSEVRTSMPRAVHTTLMRFRLGCWDLDVSRFARQRGRKPRGERTCRVCGGTEVEDELHVLLECSAHEPLRRAVVLPMV
jgi:hypothetical protein